MKISSTSFLISFEYCNFTAENNIYNVKFTNYKWHFVKSKFDLTISRKFTLCKDKKITRIEIDFIKKDMNRKIIVSLLRKDIQELDLITEGFMEINEYPKAIINLALRKSLDIQSYIQQLADNKAEVEISDTPIKNEEEPHPVETNLQFTTEPEIETESEKETEEDLIELVIETEEITQTDNGVSESLEITEIHTTQTITETATGDSKTVILAEKISSYTQSRNEMLSKGGNSIISSLGNKKIDDIKQGINIGDRFRFQRELFRSNGEDMNKTLTYINQLATLDEVQSFLQSKYAWDPENETVEDFYQIIRRRFL